MYASSRALHLEQKHKCLAKFNEDSQEKLIRIVGIDETDPSRGFVSWISPLAKALLQSKKGDVVLFRSPKGEEELEIIDVYYQSL
jgi:transcription elongation factor GreB